MEVEHGGVEGSVSFHLLILSTSVFTSVQELAPPITTEKQARPPPGRVWKLNPAGACLRQTKGELSAFIWVRPPDPLISL